MFGHRSTQAVCILALLVGLVVPTTGAGVPAAVGAVPVESGTKPPWSLDIGAEGYDHPAADDMRWMRLDRPGLSWGRNLATLFLDVTGRTTARPGPIPLEGGNARLLDVSTMPPKLREALRLAPDAELVATVTRPNERSLKDDPGYHSEPLVISDGMELLRVLGVRGNIRSRLRQLAKAVGSERSWCSKCRRKMRQHVPNAGEIYLKRLSGNEGEDANKLATMFSESKKKTLEKQAMETAQGAYSPGAAAPDPCLGGGHAIGPDGLVDIKPVCGHTESSSGLAAAMSGRHGGIDFRSLELNYLSDVPSGSGHEVAFAFATSPGGPAGSPLAAVRGVRQASDAFFVWLALPASDFWVNLNPNEPHRIIDEEFGRTDAGRVLLEADLQLKKSVARFTDPRRPRGKKYWESLIGRGKCVSMRQWIVPGKAVVHATDEELYIVKAPLRVKMESSYIDDQGTGHYRSCRRESPRAEAHNERVYRRQILPLVERRVNHGREYAELRRVYRSRVAAEWIRERHGYQRTAYDDVIGSANIGRWASRSRWKPLDTFRAYVQSYEEHEYELVDRVRVGNTIYTNTYAFGGVDFASVPMRKMDGAALDRELPGLTEAAAAATEGLTRLPGSDRMLLGGTTVVADPDVDSEAAGGGGGDGPVKWWQVLLGLVVVTVVLSIGSFVFGARQR